MLRLRGIASTLLASLVLLPGCKNGSEGTAAAHDGGTLAPNPVPHRITKDMCAGWTAHGVQVTLDDWKAAANRCPMDVQKQLADRLDGQRPSIDAAALQVCSKHLGEMYVPGDASCYMAATTAKGLADCKFSALTNPGDTDIASEIDHLRARCEAPQPGGSSAPML